VQKIIVNILVVLMIVGVFGCKGKNSNEKVIKLNYKSEKSISLESNDKDTIDNDTNKISKEQLNLVNRIGFDRSVLTYDTTDFKKMDSIPFRLLSEEEINKRLPWKRIISGYLMTNNGIGYEYKNKDWHIKTKYPGVIGYYPRSWGDYAKKIEFYDESENLMRSHKKG